MQFQVILLNCLEVGKDGSICAKRMSPGVSEKLLREIHGWRMEGASDKDVIIHLRQRTVPDGYSYHTWIPGLLITVQVLAALCNGVLLCVGKSETPLEMLKSILAQLEFQYEILEWEKKGIPFCSHVYVPEVHPLTGVPFHEREDEAHVFKV